MKIARRRPNYHLPSVPFAHLNGARPERASLLLAFLLNLPPLWRAAREGQLIVACLLNLPPLWHAARAGQLIIALLLHIARGPSGPVCHTPYMPDLRRSPLRVKSAHGWGGGGDALLFYLEWSRTPSPRCPRPPNGHALRTKLILFLYTVYVGCVSYPAASRWVLQCTVVCIEF